MIERSHSSDGQVSAASTSSGGSASRGRLSDQMPGDGSGGSRSSCSRQAGTGVSTVTQMAAKPLDSARATRSRVSSRSVNQYSWNHGLVSVGPTSSNRTLAPELMTIVVPSASAARAVASSASGCAKRWSAVGANRIGSAIVRPEDGHRRVDPADVDERRAAGTASACTPRGCRGPPRRSRPRRR